MKFLFSTGTNQDIEKVLVKVGFVLHGKVGWQQFKDNEWYLQIKDNIKNKKVYILGSTFPPADNILKLYLLIKTLRDCGASNAELLVPYFGYARQDRPVRSGEGMVARYLFELLKIQNFVKKINCIDLHSRVLPDKFPGLIKNLESTELFVRAFKKINWRPHAVIAPDYGAAHRAENLARALKVKQVAWCEKIRPAHNVAKVVKCHGLIKGLSRVVIIDDLIDTGLTILQAIKKLKSFGVNEIVVAATHGIFSDKALVLLCRSGIKKLYITDSIPHKKLPKWIEVLSSANLFVEN